jgi:MFS family permease
MPPAAQPQTRTRPLLVLAICCMSLLIVGGSTGDRIGRAWVFQLGLVLFTLASLACSLAPGIG